MSEYIAWTICADKNCKKEIRRAEKHGEKARYFMRVFRELKGALIKEGDIIYGCRIDKIGAVDHE